MQSRGAKLALSLGAIAVIVILFVVLNGNSGDKSNVQTANTTTADNHGKPAKPAVPLIVVKHNSVVGGEQDLSFTNGDQVRFNVRSDAKGQIHVHGYNILKDVGAGQTVKLSFPAKLEGVFDVEMHPTDLKLAKLTVNP